MMIAYFSSAGFLLPLAGGGWVTNLIGLVSTKPLVLATTATLPHFLRSFYCKSLKSKESTLKQQFDKHSYLFISCPEDQLQSMSEQQLDAEYVYFIFAPALCSLFTSSLLLINFTFISKHLHGFMYHKLSSTLALFDVIQQIGTVLSAPFLLSADADKCAYREYLFLFGSFCKTLTVLYISGTISYVIHYSKVPEKDRMRSVAIGLGLFTMLCFIIMPIFNASGKGTSVILCINF